jgi:ATP-binding cassette subfamily F protein 3
MASIDALINALKQYEGTLIFISHDVYFIRALASTVLHINAGRLTPYAGDYQYYLEKSKAVSERAALTAGEKQVAEQKTSTVPVAAPSPRKSKEQKRLEAEERNARSRVRKEHQHKVSTIEARIVSLELQQKKLAAQLEDPATYGPGGNAVELNRELMSVADLLERLTQEWETLAAVQMPD